MKRVSFYKFFALFIIFGMTAQTMEAGFKDTAKNVLTTVVNFFTVDQQQQEDMAKELVKKTGVPEVKVVVAQPSFFASALNNAKRPFAWAWNEHRVPTAVFAIAATLAASGLVYWMLTPDEDELEGEVTQ